MDRTRVLRPQRGTFDNHSHDSLSAASWLAPFGGDKQKVGLVRTKMVEPSTCIPALTVSRCTHHNLTAIAAVHDSQ